MNSSAAQTSLQDVQSAVNRMPPVDAAVDTRQVTGIHLGHNAAAALVEDG